MVLLDGAYEVRLCGFFIIIIIFLLLKLNIIHFR